LVLSRRQGRDTREREKEKESRQAAVSMSLNEDSVLFEALKKNMKGSNLHVKGTLHLCWREPLDLRLLSPSIP